MIKNTKYLRDISIILILNSIVLFVTLYTMNYYNSSFVYKAKVIVAEKNGILKEYSVEMDNGQISKLSSTYDYEEGTYIPVRVKYKEGTLEGTMFDGTIHNTLLKCISVYYTMLLIFIVLKLIGVLNTKEIKDSKSIAEIAHGKYDGISTCK